jgi:hypothetical protein
MGIITVLTCCSNIPFFSMYRCVAFFFHFVFVPRIVFPGCLSEWMKYLRIERHLAAKFGTVFAAFSAYVFFAMGG